MRRLLLFPALALMSHASALGIGDAAPDLKFETLVKGRTVALDKGLHVVDFWASWSEPSQNSIPKLSQLAKKFKGKIDVTGISVGEMGDDPLAQVKKFVADMGSKMDYNVAYDGKEEASGKAWMQAAKQHQLPTSFLVRDGLVIWIGKSDEGLDKAVETAVDGKFDLEASKAKYAADQAKVAAAEAEAKKKIEEFQKLFQPVMDAMQEGNIEDALDEIDKLEKSRPDYKPQLIGPRFSILAGTGNPKLVDFAKRLVADDLKDNADALNSLAWAIVDPKSQIPKPNFDAALILAKRAAEASKMKDGMILDTLALCLFKTGDKAKALEYQTKAVELAKTDKRVDAETMKDMQDRLEQFKKAKSSV